MSDVSDRIAQLQACVPLGRWLEHAHGAGVPFIPTEWSEPIPVAEILNFECLDALPCYEAATRWATERIAHYARQGERWMWRWEHCGSGTLKYAMSKPDGGYDSEWLGCGIWDHFPLDDERLWDCTVGETTRICVRPWVDALSIEGYPVEFRAFFDGPDRFLGISSYYPQRPLPDDEHVSDFAYQVECYAKELMWQIGSHPYGCTMDFIVRASDRQVLFLEGGPAHHDGDGPNADPCCFRPGEIKGYALADRNERNI